MRLAACSGERFNLISRWKKYLRLAACSGEYFIFPVLSASCRGEEQFNCFELQHLDWRGFCDLIYCVKCGFFWVRSAARSGVYLIKCGRPWCDLFVSANILSSREPCLMWYFNFMRYSCVGWVCLAACSGVYLIDLRVASGVQDLCEPWGQ